MNFENGFCVRFEPNEIIIETYYHDLISEIYLNENEPVFAEEADAIKKLIKMGFIRKSVKKMPDKKVQIWQSTKRTRELAKII